MRILLIDDHPIFTQGLKLLLLELDSAMQCVVACNLGNALALQEPFDLLLLDLHMPDTDGLLSLQSLSEKFQGVPIIMLSSDEDASTIRRMMVQGAAGYIPKSSTPAVLIAALRLILSGGTYWPPEAFDLPAISPPTNTANAPAATLAAQTPTQLGLSQRQCDVLVLLAQGKSNKLIARELGLSEGTVKTHIASAFRALQVNSRTEAAYKANQLGFGAQS